MTAMRPIADGVDGSRSRHRLATLEKELLAWHRANELSQRLATIPGVGIISATARAASVSEPERFRSGRQFAASLGLTPLQKSSGGNERMGRITRMGMTSLVRRASSGSRCRRPMCRSGLSPGWERVRAQPIGVSSGTSFSPGLPHFRSPQRLHGAQLASSSHEGAAI
jgi:hypothetical protein